MNAVVKQLRPAFRIEKNIPMPRPQLGGPCPYPFLDMLVGDSFFVPSEDAKRTLGMVDKAKRRFVQTTPGGYRFSCRTVPGGVRCWRTK